MNSDNMSRDITRFVDSRYIAPNGVNWGGYDDAKVNEAIDKIRQTFDAKADQDVGDLPRRHPCSPWRAR